MITNATHPSAALMHIALKMGYLVQEGLDVIPQPHTFGKLALESVMNGKADLATVGDTPFMLAVMNNRKIITLAAIETATQNEAIVGRKDRGINVPSDLMGKNIGVTSGTTGDYFLDWRARTGRCSANAERPNLSLQRKAIVCLGWTSTL